MNILGELRHIFRRGCVAMLIVCACVTASACGRKGDPFISVRPAPDAVRGLAAVARPGEILLIWQVPRKNIDETDLLDLGGFYLFRARESLADYCVQCPRSYKLLFDYEYRGPRGRQPDGGRYVYRDREVQPENVYFYRLQAYSAAGTAGPAARVLSVYFDHAPDVPQGFKIERSNSAVVLSWQPVEVLIDGRPAGDDIGYSVYRSLQSGEYGLPLNDRPIQETRFEDIPPVYDTDYYYVVRSVRMSVQTPIESDPAREIMFAYLDRTPPETPRLLTAIAQPDGVLLKWQAVIEKGVAGYHVYRRPAGSDKFRLLTTDPVRDTSWLDTTVVMKRRYEYAVTAVDDSLSANESPLSRIEQLYYGID